jgi:superfamily II DNA or RNA helicase
MLRQIIYCPAGPKPFPGPGNDGKIRVLAATGQFIGEGFNCREPSARFLAIPIKFNGRLPQYLGRILRPAPGKDHPRVFDYCDVNAGY